MTGRRGSTDRQAYINLVDLFGVVWGGGGAFVAPRRLLSVDQIDQFDAHEVFETIEVLAVHFDVVVAGALDPERINWLLALLVDRHAVREVDHFVLGAVDHENWRLDLRDLVDRGERVEEPRAFCGGKGDAHAGHQRRVEDHSADFVSTRKI